MQKAHAKMPNFQNAPLTSYFLHAPVQLASSKENSWRSSNVSVQTYIKVCDPQSETLTREGNFWITFINSSISDYLIHPYCPLNYCKSSGLSVSINLNIPNGADTQCANHRTGVLCGTCQSGFSLSLGSSHCIKCPGYWPEVLVALILASAVSGIALVL